jgi:hypothetical protein
MTDSLEAAIVGIASVDGDTVDHETVEISSDSEIVSDGPVAIELSPAQSD